jgi:hypothetical protein
MIVYSVNGLFRLKKRYVKMRVSDKNKRIDDRISKLRKQWWHFRTRWTEKK